MTIAKIRTASAALDWVENLNNALAMPNEYQALVRNNRKPIQDHFGDALFPIPSEFDTGVTEVTSQRLAKALIDPDSLNDGLGYFYVFMPPEREFERKLRTGSGYSGSDLYVDTMIRFMLYDYACLHNFRMPYKRLLVEVGKKTPGALFDLIQVDKTFLTCPVGSNIVTEKQHEADWEFFEKLGEAIKKKPLDEPEYMFRAKMICAYFWDTDFKDLSYRQMVEALEQADVFAPGVVDPRSLSKALNRQGLKKTRHTRN